MTVATSGEGRFFTSNLIQAFVYFGRNKKYVNEASFSFNTVISCIFDITCVFDAIVHNVLLENTPENLSCCRYLFWNFVYDKIIKYKAKL
ncbi:hypothetical protein MAR_001928 [Mya arenaria]|uniref:Uncharacterized protein n=1 Tax=Mya arenaria TaxID=6604 RepID=A0ABY7FD34_MYAAR|nr:hypothetical protein MAR_001928 [Mya arenaria]